MQNPAYWAIRQRVQRAGFRIARQRYAATVRVASLRGGVAIAWQLVKNTSTTAVTAVATAVLLQYLGTRVHLPAWVASSTTYDVYLAATAATAGVLLALSFAAISTLASALFVRLPSNLRSLLLYEEVTTFSIHSLAFITVLSLTALGLRSVGLSPSGLTAIALLLALPFTIVSMTLVARRVLDLFDPSVLSAAAFRQLLRSAVAAGTRQYRASDLSFQAHHHRLAAGALDTLATMVAFAQKEEQLRGESLFRLASDILNSISQYLKAKRDIPTTSRWFAQKPRYPDWYRAGSTQIDMATMTESSLMPGFEADQSWIERRLLDLTRSGYETMLDDPASGRPQRFLLQASSMVQSLGAEWDLALAKEYTDTLMATTTRRFAEPRPRTDAELTGCEGIADAITGLPTAAFLGFANSVAEFDIPQLATRISEMRWESEAGIGRLRPRIALRRLLEGIRSTVLFERRVEGRAITPGHVHASLALQELESELQAGITLGVEWFTTGAPRIARDLRAISSRLGAIACFNALGSRWRIERNLDRLRPIPNTVGRLMTDQEPAPWPWGDWHAALERTRSVLQVELANTLPGLAATPRQAERPDLLGEAVHRIGEGCFVALVHNRLESFTTLFPHYFAGVLLKVNQLQQQQLGAQELGLSIQDAMLDLVNLSGYARIWASLHANRQYWTTCRTLWNDYLRDPDAPTRCQAIALMIENARLRITPRSTHRTSWQMMLARTLRDLPHEERRIRGAFIPDIIPQHPSRLIRFLGRNQAHHLYYDGATVFCDVYLRREPGCAGVAFRRDTLVTDVRDFVRLHYE